MEGECEWYPDVTLDDLVQRDGDLDQAIAQVDGIFDVSCDGRCSRGLGKYLRAESSGSCAWAEIAITVRTVEQKEAFFISL